MITKVHKLDGSWKLNMVSCFSDTGAYFDSIMLPYKGEKVNLESHQIHSQYKQTSQ